MNVRNRAWCFSRQGGGFLSCPGTCCGFSLGRQGNDGEMKKPPPNVNFSQNPGTVLIKGHPRASNLALTSVARPSHMQRRTGPCLLISAHVQTKLKPQKKNACTSQRHCARSAFLGDQRQQIRDHGSKLNHQEMDRRFQSLVPFSSFPFWGSPIFDPQPNGGDSDIGKSEPKVQRNFAGPKL